MVATVEDAALQMVIQCLGGRQPFEGFRGLEIRATATGSWIEMLCG